MRTSIAFGFALGVIAFLTQDATAQFMEKKVLTLAAARKMVVAAEAEAERGEVIGAIGASFDTPELDVQIAQAGVAALSH
jgi:hypothetical protein